MKIEEKNTIIRLRSEGNSYSIIAKLTGIKENTVKTFCRRKRLVKGQKNNPEELKIMHRLCRECGSVVILYPGRKEKKFCCDKCRNKWWKPLRSRLEYWRE